MLVSRIQRGLLRLRTVLPKFNMADAVPEEAVVAMVTQPPDCSHALSGNKHPLESGTEVTNSDTPTAAAAHPTVSSAVAAVATTSNTTAAATVAAMTATTTQPTSSSSTAAVEAAPPTDASTDEPVAMTATTTQPTSAATAGEGAPDACTDHAHEPVAMTSTSTQPNSSAAAAEAAPSTDASTDEPAAKKLKTEDEGSSSNLNKLVKRKVAMLLSYSGVGYKGMQKNPGELTIEQDLATALVKCEAITEEHAQFFGKMAFQRCARTDKGVSASGQVVSLKMRLLDDVVDRINEHLPPCIRVMGVKRTTASFNSKHNCDYRTYMYMLPTFAFVPVDQITTESYRITAEKLKEVSDLLSLYVGTHNFHNFTSGKGFKDPSAIRYIKEFKCNEAFMYQGLEFVILRVKGQSFVLHQIRKMIGLVIAIAKGFTPGETLERAFGEAKLDIPKAPGLGLVLELVHYEAYNRRWGNDGMHDPLTWEECQDQLEAFRKEHIYPTIVNTEKEQRSMMQWLSTLPLHTYDVIDTPNPYRKTAWQIEKNRREAQMKTTSASSENTPQQSTAGQEAIGMQGDGPEVTSTTTSRDQSAQNGGPERISLGDNPTTVGHGVTMSSEAQIADRPGDVQDSMATERTASLVPNEEITSTS